jgi:fumarate hydratase subunit alpha
MKEINVQEITETVARLSQEANFDLGQNELAALRRAANAEISLVGKTVLKQIISNAEIAATERIPLCQDTGYTVVFCEIGQDVHIAGGSLIEAVQEGIRRGYREGYLRKSIVEHPFSKRANTGDNTPAVVHTEIVAGDTLTLTVCPKGGGSENMSRLAMLKPSDGVEGIKEFIVRAVDEAGSNPCPPIILGIGIGGTAEKCMYIAKKALLRELGQPNPDPETAALEQELLRRVNALGIGPQGMGGTQTCLAVHIETYASHIAMLPVAVNIQCHSARHKSATL